VIRRLKILDQMPSEILDAVNEFSRKLEWARRLPVYEFHKWWARRYSGIIRLFLSFAELDLEILDKVKNPYNFVKDLYFNPPRIKGKKLLDPFCGGGTIIAEASNLGYEASGIEINRLAYLMLNTLKCICELDVNYLEKEIIKIFNLTSKIWTTKCSSGHEATIIHTFLSWKNQDGVLQIKSNRIKDGNDKIYFCEKCNRLYTSKQVLSECKYCGNLFDKKYQKIEYADLHPFAIEYFCSRCNNREFKLPNEEDYEKFHIEISRKFFEIPSLTETKRLLKAGFNDFGELITPRQAFTFEKMLESFKEEPYRSIVKLLISDSLRCCSLLAYYSNKYKKAIPGFVIKSYWLPMQPVELNPLSFYYSRSGEILPLGRGNIISSLRKIKRAKKFVEENHFNLSYNVYYGPAQEVIPKIKDTFDIIFTDPPYGDYQFYSDLSLFSLSIIGEISSSSLQKLVDNEIILRNKSELEQYRNRLKYVFSLALEKLSKNGKIFLTFHHSDKRMLFEVLSIFKSLKLNLYAIYPVIGESSGKLTKRKIYLDLFFIFGREKRASITNRL